MDHFFASLSVKYVYIDESGNTSISTDKGATPFYVPAAIMIDEQDLHMAAVQAEAIRKKFFNQGPIKSKSISQEEKRIQILEAINELPFRYSFMVIDKRLLDEDSALQYRPIFYKFINKQLYSHFLHNYSKLKIFIDNYGSSEFQESFKKYIKNHCKDSLFTDPELDYLSGRDDALIGVADFLSGSIRLMLEHRFQKKGTIANLLTKKALYYDRWPIPKNPLKDRDLFKGFDTFIRDISICNAQMFIEKHLDDPDEFIRMQSAVLVALLKEVPFDLDSRKGLYTEELIAHLSELNFKPITDRVFRQKVIGPLRDHGILISGSKNGYYLAANAKDIKQFLEHGKRIIFPMLNRIARARNTLLEASTAECDILSSEMGDMQLLRKFIDDMKDSKVGFIEPEDLDEKLYDIEQEKGHVSTEKLSK